jgi:N6-L-threonylcarbamoyladenine synthase
MRIFGIESSCDETAMALVAGDRARLVVEKSLVASQMELHKKYGGVVPEVAARQHVETIIPMLHEIVPRDGAGIDAIAVTYGPGLVPALRVGVELGRTLAVLWNKPLVAVNHLEGHIYSNWLSGVDAQFPALVLIVSGKHTEIVLMKGHGQYELLGETRDDASGEAFDKVARILGLSYPGGPIVSKMALEGDAARFDLPRPMLEAKNFDFSFSGLKTAVLYSWDALSKRERSRQQTVKDMAAGFQEAVVSVLVTKMTRAIEQTKPKTVMIAAAGYFHALKKDFIDPLNLEADPNLEIAS